MASLLVFIWGECSTNALEYELLELLLAVVFQRFGTLSNEHAERVGHQQRIEDNDPYFRRISEQWSLSLREAVNRLPPFEFSSEEAKG